MVSLLVETWTWWSLSTLVLIARLVARWIHFGSYKRFQADDYLIVLAYAFYTTEIVTINIISQTKTNLLPPGYQRHHHAFTPAEIAHREYGSKVILVVEQCQMATVWTIKVCLLLMYFRITRQSFRAQNIAIIVLMVYVAFGFVFMEIFYFGVWCRPFHDYWAVPTPDPAQCAAAINHLICNAVFNLSSDIAMLLIAVPMFLRTHLPLQRKAILCSAFGLAIFVIICAILNKFYSFSQPFGSKWSFWYIRESSTAMLVANLPFTWILIRKVFGVSSFDNKESTRSSTMMSPIMSRKGITKIKNHLTGKDAGESGRDTEQNLTSSLSSEVQEQVPEAMHEQEQVEEQDQVLVNPAQAFGQRSQLDAVYRKASWQKPGLERGDSYPKVLGKLEAEALAPLEDELEDYDEEERLESTERVGGVEPTEGTGRLDEVERVEDIPPVTSPIDSGHTAEGTTEGTAETAGGTARETAGTSPEDSPQASAGARERDSMPNFMT